MPLIAAPPPAFHAALFAAARRFVRRAVYLFSSVFFAVACFRFLFGFEILSASQAAEK